jgi:hypothetical protein
VVCLSNGQVVCLSNGQVVCLACSMDGRLGAYARGKEGMS